MPDVQAAGGPTTLRRLLAETRARFAAAGIDNAALDARLLVEHFTGTSRIDAVREPYRPVGRDSITAVECAVARRVSGEPVHRIIGFREFYGLPLKLSPETLEPRPDTEVLVDLVLPFVRRIAASEGACRILDLGTGTGAIALALLSAAPGAHAVGVDISADALATAAANADMLGLGDRFDALRSDWFDRIEGRFHLIVSNPPYIPSGGVAALQAEVRDFDPRRALDGGADGLDAYRSIAAGAMDHLFDGALVAVEIGYDQKAEVTELFERAGYRLVKHARDLAGHDRALVFQRRQA